MRTYVIWILSVVLQFSAFAGPEVAPDGIQWKFEAPGQVEAIGDIHGDPDALLAILESRKLIELKENGKWKWAGKNTHLVFTGDLVDRGPDSRTVLDVVMELQKKAQKAGGKVHVLYGNHELMTVALHSDHFLHPFDVYQYRDFAPPPNEERLLQKISYLQEDKSLSNKDKRELAEEIVQRDQFKRNVMGYFRAMTHPKSPYAAELSKRNTILQVNDTVFVHAGLDKYLKKPTAEKVGFINAEVRKAVAAYQKAAFSDEKAKLSDESRYLIGDDGPLWTRRMAMGRLEPKLVNKTLDSLGASRVVSGHTVGRKIEKLYDERAYIIDTANSIAYGGELSALEIPKGQKPITHDRGEIKRPRDLHPLTAHYLDARSQKQALVCKLKEVGER